VNKVEVASTAQVAMCILLQAY